ncbi:MAG: hypothetical protein PGN15_12505 [Aeromicrobium erythreum]
MGNTALAVLQIVSYAAAGVVGLLLTGQTGALDVVGLPMLWYVLFFLVGFVALASLWGRWPGRSRRARRTSSRRRCPRRCSCSCRTSSRSWAGRASRRSCR